MGALSALNWYWMAHSAPPVVLISPLSLELRVNSSTGAEILSALGSALMVSLGYCKLITEIPVFP